MAALVVYLVLFLALTGHSSATYCVCKDGVSDQTLQKTLDYACGAGADCTPIAQNGACYNPNTVKDHCSYAVNSYFQKKGQTQGSCDFSGTATNTTTAPAVASTSCVYPASQSQAGTTTTTPSTTPPSTTTPSTTPTTSATPATTTTTPASTTPSSTVFGSISPAGSTGTITDSVAGGLVVFRGTNVFFPLALTFWLVLVRG